jgi:hypothetical protein
MRWIDRLSKSQRVVVVIALGLALGTLGSYLDSLGGGYASGWSALAPVNTAAFYAPSSGLRPWLLLIVWLVLIGVWALGSVRVLRPSSGDAPPQRPS